MKNIDYRWVLAGTALVLLIILFWKPLPLTDAEPEVFYIETDEEPAEPVTSAAEIAVHVAGAVRPSRRVQTGTGKTGGRCLTIGRSPSQRQILTC